jgi:hypothetical protein
MKLRVTDDSGFLALIDPDSYAGFVGADWEPDDLRSLFYREMAARHLLIWGTGQEGRWTVEVSVSQPPAVGIRDVVGSIASSHGRLLLTNYKSLTMAAQFKDVVLPEAHQADLIVRIEPGAYRCRVVQTALAPGDWADGPTPEFFIALTPVPGGSASAPWTSIPWMT